MEQPRSPRTKSCGSFAQCKTNVSFLFLRSTATATAADDVNDRGMEESRNLPGGQADPQKNPNFSLLRTIRIEFVSVPPPRFFPVHQKN